MDIRAKTCCFSGHRQIPMSQYATLYTRLRREISVLATRGVRYFGAGGALGFDTMAANAVLELKQVYPHLRLILVLPCPEQTRLWTPAQIAEYERVKHKSDKVVYVSPQYTPDCMHKRNRHLVDHSSICLCYLTKHNGGTAQTVAYAQDKHLEIHNLAYGFTTNRPEEM